MNRRELLYTLLGLPVAATAGCDSYSLPPSGELLETNFTLGHRLREPYRPKASEENWQDVPVVIVGAGIAGLSAAWALRRGGFDDFVILELEDHAGGTARGDEAGGFRYPWGAHYITSPMPENVRLIELLREMGVVESLSADGEPVVAEQFLCREPEERIFTSGRWVEGIYPSAGASGDDLRQFAEFREAMMAWSRRRDAQNRRFFAIPIAGCSDDPAATALDEQSMLDWMTRQGWSSPRLRWYVDYACRDDYGLSIDRTSAWAGVFYFAARVREGREGSQDVITWPEGNGRIVNHLMSRVGEHLRPGQMVSRIMPPPDDASTSTEVVCVDKAGRASGYRADRVIFAAPQFIAPHVIDGFATRTGRSAGDFRYGAWLVANVHLSGRPREDGFPMCWDNVIEDSKSLGYVVSTHQRGADHGPTVLTWYYAFADTLGAEARAELMKCSWSDWADLVLRDLGQAHPDIGDLVTRLDVMRWGHAMVQPYPGFIWGSTRRNAASPDGSIHFANTDLSGVALMEEAFYHGTRAADEVLVTRG